jgi:hypothetical protein
MEIKSFKYSVFAALALTATSAQAILMLETDSSNAITGVSGLTVGGVVYDATFNDITAYEMTYHPSILYPSLFASEASSALASFLATVVTDPFDPSRFVGCTSDQHCVLLTVFDYAYPGFSPPNPVVAYAAIVDQDGVRRRGPGGDGFDTGPLYGPEIGLCPEACTGIYSGFTYPEFSLVTWQSSAVPEPPVALLMASGLFVFGVTRRKRRA